MDTEAISAKNEIEDTRVCQNLARLLEVSSAQIEMAMRDGGKAFQNLALISTDIFKLISVLQEQLGDHSEETEMIFRELEKKRNDAMGSFQFFDLLNQRVDHGVNSVSQLSRYLKDKPINEADEHWDDFRESITARFSLGQEKDLFELMMAGHSREDALRRIGELYSSDKRVSVEFF